MAKLVKVELLIHGFFTGLPPRRTLRSKESCLEPGKLNMFPKNILHTCLVLVYKYLLKLIISPISFSTFPNLSSPLFVNREISDCDCNELNDTIRE